MACDRTVAGNGNPFMIPYGRHSIDQQDIDHVVDVLKGGWLTCGPVVEAFEAELAAVTGAKYAISCSNGTTALHLAMLVLGIKEGDTVLVPAITFLASANAARYVRADVVFVDVDPTTGLMTAETLKAAILSNSDKNLKAVVNVHLAGQCENLEEIYNVAKEHDLLIIEDAAHAVGTAYIDSKGKRHLIGANAFSDITTFSFHPVKTIAMGEGGAVTTNDSKIAEALKLYRSHGMVRDPLKWQMPEASGPWYYEMQDLGYNYRISDIHCALGLNQLKRLQDFKAERARLVKAYDEAFSSIPHITPLRKLDHSDTAIGKSRTQVMNYLKDNAIGTQVHYTPLYHQPYYKKLYGDMKLSGAEKYYEGCLSLPLYVGLTESEQRLVIEKLSKCG